MVWFDRHDLRGLVRSAVTVTVTRAPFNLPNMEFAGVLLSTHVDSAHCKLFLFLKLASFKFEVCSRCRSLRAVKAFLLSFGFDF